MAARSPAICRPPPVASAIFKPPRPTAHPNMAPLAPEVAPSSWQIGGSKSYCAPAPPSSDRPLDMPLRSPNGGIIFLPTSPPVDPCAFGLCSGSATATNHAPRACTLTSRWSKAVVTAPAAPATNPSLFHWIHASISCRTHQSCHSMFHWVHAFISCHTHQSHHEVLSLAVFAGKEYGIPSCTARAFATPACTPPIGYVLSSFLRSSCQISCNGTYLWP